MSVYTIAPKIKVKLKMAPQEGFEPPTKSFGDSCATVTPLRQNGGP